MNRKNNIIVLVKNCTKKNIDINDTYLLIKKLSLFIPREPYDNRETNSETVYRTSRTLKMREIRSVPIAFKGNSGPR